MLRVISLLFIGLLLLSSCSPVPSLWGEYSSPTPEFAPPITAATGVTPPPASSSPTPPPTSTFTSTPTLIPVETSTLGASIGSGSDPVLSEALITPTFDVPAVLYYAQGGDTVAAVATRFGIDPSEVHAEIPLQETGLISPGTLLVMPKRLTEVTTPGGLLFPDSEVVFSGSAADFDIEAYIRSTSGRLSTHREYLGSTGWNTGADEIRRLAYENSINPRLLLALLEYESRWVRGDAVDSLHRDYPMGYVNLYYKGLFGQMLWTVNQLSIAYYGWRTGELTELRFPDGTRLRLNPQLNAGTVALQFLLSKQHNQSQWAQMIDPDNGFLAVYSELFGDPWADAEAKGPLLPPGLAPPTLALPFEAGARWSFTGGPHGAWEHDGAVAAVDFAPFTDHGGCDPTTTWVTAAAPGTVVRSERGVVVQDLDADGYEQTGWALVYLHIAAQDRVSEGTYLQQDDRIGHASCEGGQATGTHLHFARKYNGEWIAADGPLPFLLSGWLVHEGAVMYKGTLTKGDQVVTADPVGQSKSVIIRSLDDD